MINHNIMNIIINNVALLRHHDKIQKCNMEYHRLYIYNAVRLELSYCKKNCFSKKSFLYNFRSEDWKVNLNDICTQKFDGFCTVCRESRVIPISINKIK